METVVKKLYEGMFLVDSAKAASDWSGVEKSIKNILKKSGAEIVSLNKWAERSLAYEIDGLDRGTYLLSYFKVEGPKIREIEREVQLSEQIMRVLILSTDTMSQEDIERATPAMAAEKRSQEVSAAKAEEERLSAEKSQEAAAAKAEEERLSAEKSQEVAAAKAEEERLSAEKSQEAPAAKAKEEQLSAEELEVAAIVDVIEADLAEPVVLEDIDEADDKGSEPGQIDVDVPESDESVEQ